MIALHIREHIKDDTTFNVGFGVFSSTIGGGLEHGLAFFSLGVFDSSPLGECAEFRGIFGPECCSSIKEVGNVKVLSDIHDS